MSEPIIKITLKGGAILIAEKMSFGLITQTAYIEWNLKTKHPDSRIIPLDRIESLTVE